MNRQAGLPTPGIFKSLPIPSGTVAVDFKDGFTKSSDDDVKCHHRCVSDPVTAAGAVGFSEPSSLEPYLEVVFYTPGPHFVK